VAELYLHSLVYPDSLVRERRFLAAHQHKIGHSVPFEVKIKATGIIR